MNKIHFFSQNVEDYFLFRNFFNVPRNDGIYIELGGQNGVENSNTLFFELYLNYKGMIIEPTPNQFQQLIQNRSKNYCENYAIDINKDTKSFIGHNGCSGLVDTMNKEHKERWHSNEFEYKVETIPIKDLIKKNNIKYIDFFSIDVEGGELNVLKSMDWSIPVYIICIELDNQNIIKDNKCRELLNNNNFKFFIRLNNNDFYINENYFRKNLLYDKNMIHPILNNKLNFDNNDYKIHGGLNEKGKERLINELQFIKKIEDFEKTKKVVLNETSLNIQ